MTNYITPFIKAILFFALILSSSLASAQEGYDIKVDNMHAHLKGKIESLKDLIQRPATDLAKIQDKKSSKVKDNFTNIGFPERIKNKSLPLDGDPFASQNNHRSVKDLAEPTLIIEGIDQSTTNIFPPDPNGDVSRDHYIQIINASWFRIFEKDGTPLTDATSTNTLWGEIGEASIGDPIVTYDENADRWLLTDLADLDRILYAVSETSDPMGAWFIYAFGTPAWVDYPKYGIWPTAYIFTANEAGTGGGRHPVYCINREQLLNGDATVDIQRVDIEELQGGFPTLTPMDWNSPMMPATEEIHVARINDDAWSGAATDVIEVWSINLDWEDASNTSFSSVSIPTAPFDTEACPGLGLPGTACVSQPEVGPTLDGIMTILMNNVAYWNYGTHESAVYNTSVDADVDLLTVRWGELRRYPGGEWELYQEGGVAGGDNLHRWMGSISINGDGDIGLAYSVSGDTLFPSLRYTGRRNGDPLGEMTFDEFQFATGTSAFTASNRFGDYSRMTVDPIDDSFWFTAEYLLGDNTYGSKIVNFELSRDTFDIGPTALISPVTQGNLTDTEIVTIQINNRGLEPATNITVGYIFENGIENTELAMIDTLHVDSVYTHTFTATADMADIGNYAFSIFTNFAEDQNLRNDSLNFTIRNIPNRDVSIGDIKGLDNTICAEGADIQIELKNLGFDTLKTVDLNYALNGGPFITQNETVNLAINESASINLSLNGFIDGINTIDLYTSAPNGLDDQVPVNDSLSQSFNVQLTGEAITLLLLTDDYPSETSWELLDQDNNQIYSGGGYTQRQTVYSIPMCLADEMCYRFIIYDTAGDGLQWNGVTGNYSIVDEMGNDLISILNINFGSSEAQTFCLNVPCNVTADIAVQDASTSNSQDGWIIINPQSGISPFQYSINGGTSFSDNPLFLNLDDGDYTVVIEDSNNCIFTVDVTVGTTVSNINVSDVNEVRISPNPSANGAFHVKVDGISNHLNKDLELRVMDSQGKIIQYEHLARMNTSYEGMVSLKNHPAGTYYFQFVHDDLKGKAVKKVIRL